MYDDHYGLSGRPFQLTPDPAFWFDTATHRKAMAYLGYGLSQGEGFIVITGDPGAGKTTLVGHLMATIDPERLNVIRLVTTQVEPDDLLRLVAAGLDVNHGGLTKAQLLSAIERGLHGVARSGRRTLLVVDEAQSLPVSAIEELRMLSNFQAGGYALLQIFLLGQPEFRARLHGSERLEQLRQRVIAMHHLEPMGEEEVGPYLHHRLSVVGANGRPTFSAGAIAAMHRWSGGIPRRLNQLASRVLLYGAIEAIDRFKRDDIHRVTQDLDGDGLGMPADGTVATPKPAFVDMHADMPSEASPITGDTRWEPGAETGRWTEQEEEEPATPVPNDPVPEPEATVIEYGTWREPAGPDPDAAPRSMTPTPPPVPPRPIHLSVVESPAPFVAPAVEAPAAIEGAGTAEPDGTDEEWMEAAAQPVDDADVLRERIAALEDRLEEQEAALRRVLNLLVDWVEGDQQHPDRDALRARA